MATKRQRPIDGTIMHVYLRGARKLPIVTDEEDRWLFLDSAYRANRRDPERTKPGSLFLPDRRPQKDSMVDVIAFCLLENHFHLQIRVKKSKDATTFMRRLCVSVTANWQKKTGHSGRVFEATYRRKVVRGERQSRVLFVYISIKNAAEAAGVSADTANLDDLIEAAKSYKFCSLPDYYLGRNLPIVEKSHFLERFPSLEALREFASARPKKLKKKTRVGPSPSKP